MFSESAVYGQWSTFMTWHLYKGARDFDDVLQEEIDLPQVVQEAPSEPGAFGAAARALGNGLLAALSQTKVGQVLSAAGSAIGGMVTILNAMWPGPVGGIKPRLEFRELDPQLGRDQQAVNMLLDALGRILPKGPQGYKPKYQGNPGSFGKQLGEEMADEAERLSKLAKGPYKWYSGVVVDKKTGRIVSINDGTGDGSGDTVELDLIRYNGKLEVDDKFDRTKLLDDYELKAGEIKGKDIQSQIEKRKALTGREPKLIHAPYRQTEHGRLIEVPEAIEKLRYFKDLGPLISALPEVELFETKVSRSEVEALIKSRADHDRNGTTPTWIALDLDQFLRKFIFDGNTRRLILLDVHNEYWDRVNGR